MCIIDYINLFEIFEIVTDYEPMTIWGNKDIIWIKIFPVIGSRKLVLRKKNNANLYLIKKIYYNLKKKGI